MSNILANKNLIWKLTVLNIVICGSILYALFDTWFPVLPINSMGINRIEILQQGTPSVVIKRKEDIESIKRIFASTGRGISDRLACPFTLPIIFCEGNIKTVVLLGTDSCGSFLCNGKYYNFTKEERTQLISLLVALGVRKDSLTWE